MRLLVRWLLMALVVLTAGYVLPGIRVADFTTAIVAAAVLGIVNAVIRPILMFLAIPLRILTLGLFSFVINALLLLLVSAVVPGFEVHGFWAALLASIVLAIAGSFINGSTGP